MPAEVFSTPLLRENAKEGGREAEHEAREPQRVDSGHARRCLERGGVGQRVGGLVEEGLCIGGVAGEPERDEGKYLGRRLRVVWLKENKRDDEESCENGREEAGLSSTRNISI